METETPQIGSEARETPSDDGKGPVHQAVSHDRWEIRDLPKVSKIGICHTGPWKRLYVSHDTGSRLSFFPQCQVTLPFHLLTVLPEIGPRFGKHLSPQVRQRCGRFVQCPDWALSSLSTVPAE